jgi:SAM-dependent methyltransferase
VRREPENGWSALADLEKANIDFFGKLFADAKLDPKIERSSAEAEFVLSLLRARGTVDSPRVLDLGCGRGRVAIELALRGATVTGIDINQDYLREAEKRARDRGAEVKWLWCDDRKLAADAEYDAVISLYTTFGYHDDNGNARVLSNISHALVRGGLFAVEIHSRDHPFVFSRKSALDYTEYGEEVLKDYNFDPWASRLSEHYRFLRDGQITEGGTLNVRMYSLHEMAAACKVAGLRPLDVYGSALGIPFTANGEKLFLIAEQG